MTLALWIDPADTSKVTRDGSPETDRIASITDKSDANNDVLGDTIASIVANFEGADGATSYTAETGQVATAGGTAQLDNAQFKFGSTSLLLDGTGDYFTFPDSADFELAGEDFTIEAWVRWSSDPGTTVESICGKWNATNQYEWLLYLTNNQLTLAWTTDGNTGATLGFVQEAFNPVASQWYHIAATRTGDNVYFFVDGVLLGGANSVTATFYQGTATLWIGGNDAGTQDFTGHIDSVRIIKGRALWTDDFAVPTTPFKAFPEAVPGPAFSSPADRIIQADDGSILTKANASPVLTNMDGPDLSVLVAHEIVTASPEPADLVEGTLISMSGDASPLDDTGWRMKTKGVNSVLIGSVGDEDTNAVVLTGTDQYQGAQLLCNFEGDDGSTELISQDKVGRVASFVGDAQLDTAQSKFGKSSLILDGIGDYMSFPDSTDWEFGSGDFTVEFWVRFNGDPGTGNRSFIGHYTITGDQRGWLIDLTNNTLRFSWTTDGTAGTYSSHANAWNPADATWYHVAVTLSGTSLRMFIDGVQTGATDTLSATIYAASSVLAIGLPPGGSGPHNGWIDDIRIVKGAALYTANFTAPTKSHAPATLAGGAAITGMVLDATENRLTGYNNGEDSGAVAYSGTLGFAKDLEIGPYQNGYINEVIYFDGALPTDERQRAEGYLAHKWGMQDILPAAHPFKLQAPDIVRNADLVANFNGQDGDTSYTAETGQTLTFIGTAAIDDARAKYGGSSLWFDGNSDYATFPDEAGFELNSTDDFTVECWVRRTSDSGSGETILNKGGISGSVFPNWIISVNGSDQANWAVYYNGGVVGICPSTTTLSIETWYHIAGTWEAATDTLRIYVNGVLENTIVGTTNAPYSGNTNPLNIGFQPSAAATDYFHGRIEGLRIVNNKRLYVGDFTPPHRGLRLPLAADVICNFNGDDAATSYTSEDGFARVATFNGLAKLDHSQKKFGVSSLDVRQGSPQHSYINFPDSSPEGDYNPSGDFTLECWLRWDGDPGGAVTHYFASNWDAVASDRAWTVALENNTLRWAYSADGSVVSSITNAWNPDGDTWYHVCVQRFDGNLYMHIDGACIGTDPHTVVYHQSSNGLDLGSLLQASGRLVANDFDGWIDGFRFIKGTALYSRIVEPDSPFDSDIDEGDLLINFDGTDAQTTYTSDDAVGRSLTFNGSTELDTAERKFGDTSLLVTSGATDYCEVPSAADLALGLEDFTIEFWIRPSQLITTEIMFDQRTAGTSVAPAIYTDGGGLDVLRYYVNGADRIIGTTALATGRWYHVVLERVDAITRLYLDGVQEGSDYADTNDYIQNIIRIGNASYTTGNPCPGWYDGVRVVKGKAIYTGDFDVPIDAPGEPII